MPSSPRSSAPGPPLLGVVLAFVAVYVIWGSTYLAIRFAIETIPPFTMAGIRFVVAGGLLLAWAWTRGAPRPSAREVRGAAWVGVFLLLGGNGAVVWAEQWVPSGLVALLVATVPMFMVLLDGVWGRGGRPSLGVLFGLAWGLVGVALLTGGLGAEVFAEEALLGGLVVLGGSLSWAAGSVFARTARMPASPRMSTAVQMLTGGALLLVAGAGAGEWVRFELSAVSARSVWSLAYLIVFGALVAYSAYIWLLGVTTAARVSTYAYVNPVVALLLGWWLAGEPLTPRTGVAAAIILSAVVSLNRLGGGPRGSASAQSTGEIAKSP
ncbi:MAG: EamA family transporter [Gemmatimonadetes bacterium]|nr:EamA family transporter [Gemmatimonadota bacterium]